MTGSPVGRRLIYFATRSTFGPLVVFGKDVIIKNFTFPIGRGCIGVEPNVGGVIIYGLGLTTRTDSMTTWGRLGMGNMLGRRAPTAQRKNKILIIPTIPFPVIHVRLSNPEGKVSELYRIRAILISEFDAVRSHAAKPNLQPQLFRPGLYVVHLERRLEYLSNKLETLSRLYLIKQNNFV